ncbi:MAG TPA: histidinol-phosphatase HisJ family protein [Candidatus Dormibacteraeota bacterium]|nr:histidinol-phosphatase HisJ family protein [Candidatus Dormibacteraeota bacterium]
MPSIPDYHVHTEWSYDAPHGSMERSCERALEIGLPAIAFTDHADFVKVNPGQYCVDIVGYLEAVERCRTKFKNLRIHSGVELGEPHWFPEETRRVLGAGRLDHVLGSVHCVRVGDRIVDASQLAKIPDVDPVVFTQSFFAETIAMIERGQPFQTLAHLDYPKRYWHEYREQDFEEQLRNILTAAVGRELVLEVNTTRGNVLCPSEAVLRWWREAGGKAVSFGSDAHDPARIAAGFEAAAEVVEAVGFKPAPEPTALWRR